MTDYTIESVPLKLVPNEEGGYLLVDWYEAPSREAFRKGMDAIIPAMQAEKKFKLLSDTRNLGILDEEDQAWSVEDWLPRALAVGYKAIAIVVSPDVFTQITVEHVIEEAVKEHAQIQQKFFDNDQDAAAWLASLG